MRSKKNKILLGFADVAGYLSNLNIGFQQIGIETGYINTTHKFKFEYDRTSNPWILNIFNDFSAYTQSSNNPTLFKFIQKLLSILLLLYIAQKFNTVIVCSGSTLLRYYDLKFLKSVGLKIINVSLGSDTRPPYLNGIYLDTNQFKNQSIEHLLHRTSLVKSNITKLEEIVDVFINYPQHGHLNTKPFINGMYIGFPSKYIPKLESFLEKKTDNDSVLILHAPSRPSIKGSDIIRKIVDDLINEGLNIKLIEISNVSNQVVLDTIKQCDIIFDEIYSDVPLGGLGVEAAFFSKPVLVGGYYSKFINEETSKDMIPPSVYVEPDLLKDRLRELVVKPELRKNIGQKLHDFVVTKWSSVEVAMRYLQIINNNYDSNWIFDPGRSSYFHGYGLNEQNLKVRLLSILQLDGGAHNFLIDYPNLANSLVDFSKS